MTPAAAPANTLLPRTLLLKAAELFRGGQVVFIEHAGERYQLRLTRNGKLILTK